jgi:N-acetylmuramoyl-L-alanine amidase
VGAEEVRRIPEEKKSGGYFKYNFPPSAAEVSIEVDGKRVLEGEAAILDSVTYVPLRSFSELFLADSITWDTRTQTATVKKGSTDVNVRSNIYYIEAEGRYFYSSAPTRNVDDRIFVPIRIIAKALSIEVEWDQERRTVVLEDSGKALASASKFYDSDDLYWLSRIISAESAGEPLIGKIAVGNVVLNRRAHRSYPNTVYGVIFDRKGGTQFTPAVTGSIYKAPSAESVIAAKICLEGYSVDEGILFFMNPRIATNNWISRNRPFAFRISNHDFYY